MGRLDRISLMYVMSSNNQTGHTHFSLQGHKRIRDGHGCEKGRRQEEKGPQVEPSSIRQEKHCSIIAII